MNPKPGSHELERESLCRAVSLDVAPRSVVAAMAKICKATPENERGSAATAPQWKSYHRTRIRCALPA